MQKLRITGWNSHELYDLMQFHTEPTGDCFNNASAFVSHRSKGVKGMPIILLKKKRKQDVTNFLLMKVEREPEIEVKTDNSRSMKFKRVRPWECSNQVTKYSDAEP